MSDDDSFFSDKLAEFANVVKNLYAVIHEKLKTQNPYEVTKEDLKDTITGLFTDVLQQQYNNIGDKTMKTEYDIMLLCLKIMKRTYEALLSSKKHCNDPKCRQELKELIQETQYRMETVQEEEKKKNEDKLEADFYKSLKDDDVFESLFKEVDKPAFVKRTSEYAPPKTSKSDDNSGFYNINKDLDEIIESMDITKKYMMLVYAKNIM